MTRQPCTCSPTSAAASTCGREFVLYYQTTLPERHVLDIVPVLCPACEEKFFWQEVRR